MSNVVGGLVYFVITYAAGFVFGTIRQFVLAPTVGDTPALLVEIPLMLTVIYFAARAIVSALRPGATRLDAAVVGLVAFCALMLAEFAMSGLLRGWSVGEWLQSFTTINGAISLVMFAVFAVMPVMIASTSAILKR